MLIRSERWPRLMRIAARRSIDLGLYGKPRPALTIGQQIEHNAFWHQHSTDRAMDQVHASRAARRTA